MTPSIESWSASPAWARPLIESRLAPGEIAMTSLEPDLNNGLNYESSLVVLTSKQVLSFTWSRSTELHQRATTPPQSTLVYALDPDTRFRSKDHAGLGKLELVNATGRLAIWRYTVSRAEGVTGSSTALMHYSAGFPSQPQ